MENIEISDFGTELCWKQWKDLVESEGWTSDDHSVLTMTPHLTSTRCVFASCKKTGNFLGAVVWNEYDSVAFIGFYIIVPEMRGKGVGSVIWKRAISRMPKDHTIALRAVPAMEAQYRSRDTPIADYYVHGYKMEWEKMVEIFGAFEKPAVSLQLVSDLNEQEFEELKQFDMEVTKRDRSEFLNFFYSYEFTEGCVVRDENDKIVACGGIASTSTSDSHLFKLAPIYTPSIDLAALLVTELAKWAGQRDSAAWCMLHTLSGFKGEQFIPLFEKHGIPGKISGRQLYSNHYSNPIDKEMVFISHNNSGHFDA